MAQLAVLLVQRPQQVLGGANEETAHVFVAGLGDGHLRVLVSGLVAAGDKSKIGARVPAGAKPLGVVDGQGERQGGYLSDAGNLLQQVRLFIVLAQQVHLLVVGVDRFG